MYVNFFKRFLDVLLAVIAIILSSPFFIFVFFVLLFNNKGCPFFFQLRPGKNEILFKIIKFKTMTEQKDAQGNLLPDEQRLTKIGTFIRKTSLDEIPQLLNVLKGDMSFIGPRPLLPEYLPYYNEFQKRRHYVRPGISGWAQVNGRNSLSWEDKFAHDVYYVDNLSAALDFKIFVKTIQKVILSEGVTPTDQLIMPKFSHYQEQKNKKN